MSSQIFAIMLNYFGAVRKCKKTRGLFKMVNKKPTLGAYQEGVVPISYILFFDDTRKVAQAHTGACVFALKGIVNAKAKNRFIRKNLIPYETFPGWPCGIIKLKPCIQP